MKKITLNSVLGVLPATSYAMTASSEKAVAWPNGITVSSSKLRPSIGSSTPATPATDFGFNERDEQSVVTTPASSVSEKMGPGLLQKLLTIVVSESGCSEFELEPQTSFADIGMDSLMAITILATFQKETGIELPPTFFLQHQTVKEANEALSGGDDDGAHAGASPANESPAMSSKGDDDLDAAAASSVTSSEAPTSQSNPNPHKSLNTEKMQSPLQIDSMRAAPTETAKPSNSILLHGSTSSTGRNLFLLPDGSGSPSRYIQLPPLGPSINLYGLESPFVKAPTEFTCSVEAMCASFLEAIQAVQSTGPYLLGGFSLGALYAYEIAKILGERGEVVDVLFVIDMAVPKALAQPSMTVKQQQLVEAGLLPTVGRSTALQKEHFVSTVQAMTSYRPAACSAHQRPKKTVLVSSKNGLAAGKQSELAIWVQGNSASASRGWEDLVGASVERKEIDAEHFSLLRHPTVKTLGSICAAALSRR
jgi:thioesterase domain-containing protein/acyl carrier protein